MRRRFPLAACIVFAALIVVVRPQDAAACSIMALPPDQQARAVQDTIARAGVIAQGKVVGARPVAVDGRYYQQLTLEVATIWRGTPAAQITVVGASLSSDTSLATTIGIVTGTAPQMTCGGAQHHVGDDLLIFAAADGKGHLRLATDTSPHDPLATTLRAQLGAGSGPPPASPEFPPFFPPLLGVVAGGMVAGVRRPLTRWLRRR